MFDCVVVLHVGSAMILQGVTWLSYTYLHVRMRRNPMAYGVPLSDREADPQLLERRRQLITQAAETLDDRKVSGPTVGVLGSTVYTGRWTKIFAKS